MKRSALQWRFLTSGFALLILLLSSVFSAAQLAANPASVSFGSVQIGNTVSRTFLLTNTTNWTISITNASVSGSSFSLSGFTVPLTLAAGTSTQVIALFAPQGAGTANSGATFTFSIIKNNSSKRNNVPTSTLGVSFSGTGLAPGSLSASPASENFGTVQVGTTQTSYQVITNSGGVNVTISQATVTGTGFGMTGLTVPTTLSPGQSVTFTVSFAPTVSGNSSGTISILSDAFNSNLAISLSGSGAQGQLTVTPVSDAFGTVTIGATSSQSGVISASTFSVTVSSGSTNNSQFVLSGISFPLTLAAGQSAPFTITFAPQTSGAAAATLSFASNASNIPTESLSGTGATPTHSVSLSWTDAGAGIVGYNVYRGGVTGGPYSIVNTSLDATTTYSDTGVQGGQTYYYVVTAVDSNGVESTYSNEAQVVVPSP